MDKQERRALQEKLRLANVESVIDMEQRRLAREANGDFSHRRLITKQAHVMDFDPASAILDQQFQETQRRAYEPSTTTQQAEPGDDQLVNVGYLRAYTDIAADTIFELLGQDIKSLRTAIDE